MVLTHSNRIPRVLLYSGYPPSKIIFVYETVTLFRPTFQLCSTNDSSNYAGPNPLGTSSLGLGSFAFAHHYSRNRLFTFFSSGYLDVSVPRVGLRWTMYSSRGYACAWVSPFGSRVVKVPLRLVRDFRGLARPSSPADA